MIRERQMALRWSPTAAPPKVYIRPRGQTPRKACLSPDAETLCGTRFGLSRNRVLTLAESLALRPTRAGAGFGPPGLALVGESPEGVPGAAGAKGATT